MTVQDITDPATGRSRLLSDRCATCIFRPGNPMHLAPGRLASLVRDVLDRDSFIVCHDTLTYGPHPDYGPAMCRGFYNAYATSSAAVRLMHAYGVITEVPPPTEGNPSA